MKQALGTEMQKPQPEGRKSRGRDMSWKVTGRAIVLKKGRNPGRGSHVGKREKSPKKSSRGWEKAGALSTC